MKFLSLVLSMILLVNVGTDKQILCVLPSAVTAPADLNAEEDTGKGSNKKSSSKAHKRSQFKRKT